ncbi:MAG: VanZ family protein [Ruminococcus sp.]|jgi:glycopeptide antibiotics resistance protein
MDNIYEIIKTHNRPWPAAAVVCFAVILLLTAITAFLLHRKKLVKTLQAVAICGMVNYLGIVFASTVFTRPLTENFTYELEPFWSWKKVLFEHSMESLEEIVLNCLLLLPIGLLLPALAGRKVNALWGLAGGFLVSLIIELSQLMFRRGLFEWDDMIHNALGSMAGCMIMNLILYRKKRRDFE